MFIKAGTDWLSRGRSRVYSPEGLAALVRVLLRTSLGGSCVAPVVSRVQCAASWLARFAFLRSGIGSRISTQDLGGFNGSVTIKSENLMFWDPVEIGVVLASPVTTPETM